jgi:hypothetical protein
MRWLWTIPLLLWCSMAHGQMSPSLGQKLEQLGRTWTQQDGALITQRATGRPTDPVARVTWDAETGQLRNALNSRFASQVSSVATFALSITSDEKAVALLQALIKEPKERDTIRAGHYLVGLESRMK